MKVFRVFYELNHSGSIITTFINADNADIALFKFRMNYVRVIDMITYVRVVDASNWSAETIELLSLE